MLVPSEENAIDALVAQVMQLYRIEKGWSDRWKVLAVLFRLGAADLVSEYMTELEIKGEKVLHI